MPDYDKASAIIRFAICGGCGRTIPKMLAFEKTNEHFCNEDHWLDWHIRNLYRWLDGG